MKKRMFLFGAAAVCLLAAAGCQNRYEPAGVPESLAESQMQEEAGGIMAGTAIAIETARTMAVQGEAMTDTDDTVYVTGDSVNLRTAASMSGSVLGRANRGDAFHRTGYGDAWSRVEYEGGICYISSAYVTAQPPETQAADSGTETGSAAGPGESSGSSAASEGSQAEEIGLDASWPYAEFSKINSGKAVLYRSQAAQPKGKTICVNAGHGTSGGASVKTLCHPDGTPKVTGGTTGAGATTAVAVSAGMTFADGTPEAEVTLAMARILKDRLLAAGYDVLMIRESSDVQLDNVARTVLANNRADCHIALHWDSTSSDKGAFYMSVPNVASYRNMEPVKSHWEQHNALGESLVAGLRQAGVKIFSGGAMEMDLTQTSYSTVPSVDIELGDKASDHSQAALNVLADGLLEGVNRYFFGQ